MFYDSYLLMILLLFFIGLIFWSFGSVILFRLWDIEKLNWSMIKGFLVWKSQCPFCKKSLWFLDLIPFFSYIFSRGKCRYCNKKVSLVYPILEILSGLLLVFLYLYFWISEISLIVYRFFTFWLLLIVVIYDILYHELHLIAAILVFLLSFVYQIIFMNSPSIWLFVVGMWFWFLFFFCMYYFAKWYVWKKYQRKWEGLGFGDVILAGVLWTLLPFVFQYNNLSFFVSQWWWFDFSWFTFFDLSFIYFLLVSVLWLIYVFIQNLFIKNKSQILPFLPAMIVWFFVLLFRSKYLINILSF